MADKEKARRIWWTIPVSPYLITVFLLQLSSPICPTKKAISAQRRTKLQKNFPHLEQLPSLRIINCRKPTHRRHFPFGTTLFRVCKRASLICFPTLCNAIKECLLPLYLSLYPEKTLHKMYVFNKSAQTGIFKLISWYKLWQECTKSFFF